MKSRKKIELLDQLDEAEKQSLDEVLTRIDPDSLATAQIRGADQQHYDVIMETRDTQVRFQAVDGVSPPELLVLIDIVGELA